MGSWWVSQWFRRPRECGAMRGLGVADLCMGRRLEDGGEGVGEEEGEIKLGLGLGYN